MTSASRAIGCTGARRFASLALIATTDAVTSYSATESSQRRPPTRSGWWRSMRPATSHRCRRSSCRRLASSDATAPAAPSSSSVALKPFSSTRIDVVWAASTSTGRGGLLGVSRWRARGHGRAAELAALLGQRPRGLDVVQLHGAGGRLRGQPLGSDDREDGHARWHPARWRSRAGPTCRMSRRRRPSSAGGRTSPRPASCTLGGPVDQRPGRQRAAPAVTVTGLSAGTDYPYTVTSGAVSASGSLRTAALPGQTFSFAAIGDFGGGSPGADAERAQHRRCRHASSSRRSATTSTRRRAPRPELHDDVLRLRRAFLQAVRPGDRESQSFFPANGNKEYYGDGEFWANFPMPGANHSWYSYDWGDAHILVLDAEQPFTLGSHAVQLRAGRPRRSIRPTRGASS